MTVRHWGAGSRRMGAIGKFCALALIASAVAALFCKPLSAAEMLGPFGPEGARMREQLWILPSGDPARPMRATVFRPASIDGDGASEDMKHPLVVINHGTDEATRLSVAMPVYYWLSRWFVDRGYVVVLPQRRGHGATGGELSESVGTCQNADHFASGVIAADDVAAAIAFMTRQNFVQSENVIVAGVSTGGWASLALAARNLPNVAAIVNFAGGRGGHAFGQHTAVCNFDGLESAVRTFGHQARIPTIWYYAENDTFFAPQVASALARQWMSAGGLVEAHFLQPYGSEGHAIADDRAGWELWGPSLDQFLDHIASEQQIAASTATDLIASSDTVNGHPVQSK